MKEPLQMSHPSPSCLRFAHRAHSISGLLLALGALALATRARALPIFSRGESAPCAKCHTAGPVLNAEGERFMRDGYRPARAAAAHAGEARPLPLSIVLEAGAFLERGDTLSAGGGRGRRNGGEFRQHVLDLHAAGTAGENVSFHVQAGLDSAAASVRTRAAFVQFDDVRRGGALAIKVGAFDAGLPFLSRARRPTRREYLAPVEVWARGVELAGAHAAWTYAVGVMNSARTGAGAGGHGFNRLEDTYARVTRERGGQVLGGRVLFDRQDSNISFHAWLQRLQVQLGGRFGADRFWLVPAYTLDRFDDRPAPGIHQRRQYVLLEALALLGAPRDWTVAARLEHERTTPTALTPGSDKDLEVLRLERVVSPNAHVALEWSHVAETTGGPRASRLDALVRLAY
jgi:hypothetical protein